MSQAENDVGHVAIEIAKFLAKAEPGELAELRRMEIKLGARLFWRLSAQYDRIANRPEKWAVIVRMLALLTPTGSRESKESVHDGKRALGAVLCDGGQTGPVERPLLSESRLARLLAARSKIRLEALERAVKMLARNQVKLNTAELAWAVIAPERATAQIAKAYYKRLDSTAKDEAIEESKDE
ncbi:MAG: hypothetical protein F4Z15_12155 [Gammaproteobacteria bacterium]|nr:hypothetical protein [Gammaproteobacteria bacterium]MYJ52035.1 hypothetical protein [Gammaproteobacteria bacterium]